jgi:3D (Asp-Asp-Asp) domain-containing protein
MKRGDQVSDFRGFGLNVRTVFSVIVLAAAVCVPGYAADTGDGWQTVAMRVTAYCPCSKCCGEYADGITANGHRIRPGDTFAAADRRYSFGTEMLIPGYNNSVPVEVLDRGGAIKGNRLDVFFATHEEALQWGVQYLDVEVRRK